MKQPYLFSSEHLSKILEVTTSVRTRINMMAMIGPRLTDPKAKTAYFLGLFRYAEEKAQVEEILKARTQTMNSSIFSKGTDLRTGGAGRGAAGRGGRGGAGRGGAGRGRGTGSGVSLTSSISGITSDDAGGDRGHMGMTPNPSGDSYDGGRYLVHGADEVFADIDKMNHNGAPSIDDHDPPKRQTPIAMLTASDDEHDDIHDKKTLHLSTPTKSPDHGITDTEQSSISSEEQDQKNKRNSLDVKLDKELMGNSAFGTPPSKIVLSSAMNPLMRKAQEQKEQQHKTEKRVHSLRLSSSSNNTVNNTNSSNWQQPQQQQQQTNKEDISKFVPAGNVLAKMNSFCSGSVPSSSNYTTSQTRSASSTPRNSFGSKALKPIGTDYNAAVSQSARKADEKIMPGKLPLSALSLSRSLGSSSPTSHLASPVLTFSAPQSASNNDLAAKCAAVLKMTRDAFLSLTSEESKGQSEDGKDIYSYRELVRRNFVKDYTGLVQLELEKHLSADEFSKVFEKSMVSCYRNAVL